MNLANLAFQAANAFTIGSTVLDVTTTLMSLGQSITIEAMKAQLRQLHSKHKKEFDLIVKVGQLMEKLDDNKTLHNQIAKANINSVNNWGTIAEQLDRNAQIVTNIVTRMKKKHAPSQSMMKTTSQSIIGLGIGLTGAALAVYMAKTQVPKAWAALRSGKAQSTGQDTGNTSKGNSKGSSKKGKFKFPKLKMTRAINKAKTVVAKKIQFKNLKKLVHIKPEVKAKLFKGLKFAGRNLMRGLQIVKIVMTIKSIVDGFQYIDKLKEQIKELEEYYYGNDKQDNFQKNIQGTCQAIMNVTNDIFFLQIASMGVILDFKNIFTLQSAISVASRQTFTYLADKYDPTDFGFTDKSYQRIQENMNVLEQLNDSDMRIQDKLEKMYTVFNKFMQVDKPEQRFQNFIEILSKDLGGSIGHQKIWEKHDKNVRIYKKIQDIVTDSIDANSTQGIDAQQEKEAINAGKQVYHNLKSKFSKKQYSQYFQLLSSSHLNFKQKRHLRKLRKEMDVSEDDQQMLEFYLQQIAGVPDIHKALIKKIEQKYKSLYLGDQEEELVQEDRQMIAMILINFYDQFYGTDPNGQTIYGIPIKQYKTKQTYDDLFTKLETKSNYIPVQVPQSLRSNYKEQFKERFAQKADFQWDKRQIDTRFLRIWQQTEEVTNQKGQKVKRSVMHSSSGWRVQVWLKGQRDSEGFYLEKDSSKDQWTLKRENAIQEEIKKEAKIAEEEQTDQEDDE